MSGRHTDAMPPVPYPDPPPTDGVVTLRGPVPEDAAVVTAFCDDPSILPWIPLPSPYTERDFHDWRTAADARREAGEGLEVIISVDGRAVGTLGFKELARPGYTEIGYLMGAPSRGQGYASRAVRLARDHAVRSLGVERVELLIHHDNEPSQRVARAAGFAETGEYRPCRTGCNPDKADHKVFAWPGAEEA
jgi:RimJ/RimL family protein N-acetyltransferase